MTEQHQFSEGAKAFFKKFGINPYTPSLTLIYEDPIRPKAIEYIAEMPNLHTLIISSTPTNDEIGHQLEKMTKLEALKLEDVNITDAIGKHLEKMPNLLILGLRGTRVTDEIGNHLKRMPNLRDIDLERTGVSYEMKEELNAHCKPNEPKIIRESQIAEIPDSTNVGGGSNSIHPNAKEAPHRG